MKKLFLFSIISHSLFLHAIKEGWNFKVWNRSGQNIQELVVYPNANCSNKRPSVYYDNRNPIPIGAKREFIISYSDYPKGCYPDSITVMDSNGKNGKIDFSNDNYRGGSYEILPDLTIRQSQA